MKLRTLISTVILSFTLLTSTPAEPQERQCTLSFTQVSQLLEQMYLDDDLLKEKVLQGDYDTALAIATALKAKYQQILPCSQTKEEFIAIQEAIESFSVIIIKLKEKGAVDRSNNNSDSNSINVTPQGIFN